MHQFPNGQDKIAVIGLGYVGIPLLLEILKISEKRNIVGFDIGMIQMLAIMLTYSNRDHDMYIKIIKLFHDFCNMISIFSVVWLPQDWHWKREGVEEVLIVGACCGEGGGYVAVVGSD